MPRRVWTALFSIVLAAPVAAAANPIVPTFVEMLGPPLGPHSVLYAPLIWSELPGMFIPIVLITLGVAFVEALVIRVFARGRRFRFLLVSLFTINLITSLAGFVIVPHIPNLWLATTIALVEAVVLEGLLLLALGTLGARNINTCLRASALMNATSYAVFAIILAGFSWIPTVGTEDRDIVRGLRGTIVTTMMSHGLYGPHDECTWEELQISTFKLRDGLPPLAHSTTKRFQGGRVRILSSGRIVGARNDSTVLVADALGKPFSSYHLPLPARGSILSPDCRYACCDARDSILIVDLVQGRIKRRLPMPELGCAGQFSHDNRFLYLWSSRPSVVDLQTGRTLQLENRDVSTTRACFSPTENKIAMQRSDGAIAVYDCLSGTRHIIVPPGEAKDLLWTPDGKYVAYTTHGVDPHTVHFHPLDLRIVTLDGRRSATVLKDIGYAESIVWLAGDIRI